MAHSACVNSPLAPELRRDLVCQRHSADTVKKADLTEPTALILPPSCERGVNAKSLTPVWLSASHHSTTPGRREGKQDSYKNRIL